MLPVSLLITGLLTILIARSSLGEIIAAPAQTESIKAAASILSGAAIFYKRNADILLISITAF